MSRLRFRSFVPATLVLLLLAPGALAHDDHEAHDYEEHAIDATFAIEGFQLAELNFDAAEGEQIVWSVATDAETAPYVDVHAHNESGPVMFFTDNGNRSIQETFVVPEDGQYSIMIRNEQRTEAEFTLKVDGRFALLSTQGFAIEEDSPTLPMVLAVGCLVVLAVAVAWTRR